MISVEFRRICGAAQHHDKFLVRVALDFVPNQGEMINIFGDPYVVRECGWSLDNDMDLSSSPVPAVELWCYIRLSPLQGPALMKRPDRTMFTAYKEEAVPCSKCGAPVGEECVNLRKIMLAKDTPHAERVQRFLNRKTPRFP